jgi:hypothetical protein
MATDYIGVVDDDAHPPERITRGQATSHLDARATDYILGVSGMETGFGFRKADLNGRYSPGCPRTWIGFERYGGNVHGAAWADPVIKKFLLTHQLANENSAWTAKIMKAPPSSKVIHAFFEDVIVYRFAKLLRHFSMGPTQMLLLYTGVGGWPTAPGRPDGWDGIHSMYIKEERAALWRRLEKQLAHGPVNDSDEAAIIWLQTHQTGGKTANLASDYWYGKGYWAGRPGAKGYRAQAMGVRYKGVSS